MWIGTIGGGLNKYDYKSSTFKQCKHHPEDPKSLYNDAVNHIYESSSGKLYISVYNSLELFDYKNDNFIHYQHDFNDSTSRFGNII